MFHVETERLLAILETLRKRLCAYGGGAPCDCKFAFVQKDLGTSECTGCPEIYQAMDIIRGDDAAKKEQTAFDRGVSAERDRCAKLVDPETTPLAWDSCNAFTCLAAATNMIERGLKAEDLRVRDNNEVSKQLLARRKAQQATRKAAKP